MTTDDEKKKPLSTFMPIEFWSNVVTHMDNQVLTMSMTKGHGEVSARIIIKNGIVLDVVYGQENRVRQVKSEEEKNPKW